MPNYKLSLTIREQINARCKALTGLRVAHALGDFPLTADQVQEAIMQPHYLATLRELTAGGLQNLPTNSMPGLGLFKDYLPMLQRNVYIVVNISPAPYVPRIVSLTLGKWSVAIENHALRLDAGILGDAEREALATWANAVVREARLKEMADATVKHTLDACHSVADIAANYNILSLLVSDPTWVTRFRNAPGKLERYIWPDHIRARLDDKRLRATEVVLHGALMLSRYKRDITKPIVTLGAWQPLETDPVFS